MGQFYFDESIRSRGGFILGAYVYSEHDLQPTIASLLTRHGYTPGIDEFKSSSRMDADGNRVRLRDDLRKALSDARIGIVISPDDHRPDLGLEALLGLKKIVANNALRTQSHEVYFDQGIFSSLPAGAAMAADLGLNPTVRFHFEEDSRAVLGLQVADLVAHSCGTMLLEQMGLVTKLVRAGPNSGYDPDLQIELGFELWARLRYRFFSGAVNDGLSVETNEDMMVDVASHGLHIASSCDPTLRTAVESRFATWYLGCIH